MAYKRFYTDEQLEMVDFNLILVTLGAMNKFFNPPFECKMVDFEKSYTPLLLLSKLRSSLPFKVFYRHHLEVS